MENEIRIPNAKKWTVERVTEELIAIKGDALREDVDYLGIAIVRQGLYIQLWAYWKKIFADNDDILEQMMMIESIFEARMVQAALNKKVSPWIAVFVLKNNHNWSDRTAAETLLSESRLKALRLDQDTVALPSDRPGWAHTYRRVG